MTNLFPRGIAPLFLGELPEGRRGGPKYSARTNKRDEWIIQILVIVIG